MTLLSNSIAHAAVIETLAKERDHLRSLHHNQTRIIGVLLEEVEALRRERNTAHAEAENIRARCERLEGYNQKLRARVNDLKTAVYPYLYGFGGTITGRAGSSQPNLQNVKKADSKDSLTPAKSPAFAAPYSGLQAHSVGSQYPFTVVGYETADGTRYGVQNLLTGKYAGFEGVNWAAYPTGTRYWKRASGASSFIDQYCVNREFAKYDDQGEEITWVSR